MSSDGSFTVVCWSSFLIFLIFLFEGGSGRARLDLHPCVCVRCVTEKHSMTQKKIVNNSIVIPATRYVQLSHDSQPWLLMSCNLQRWLGRKERGRLVLLHELRHGRRVWGSYMSVCECELAAKAACQRERETRFGGNFSRHERSACFWQ